MRLREILDNKEGILDTLEKCGLLRSRAKRDIEIFEYYLEEWERTCSSTQAVINAADKFHLSDKGAEKVILRIKKNKDVICMS